MRRAIRTLVWPRRRNALSITPPFYGGPAVVGSSSVGVRRKRAAISCLAPVAALSKGGGGGVLLLRHFSSSDNLSRNSGRNSNVVVNVTRRPQTAAVSAFNDTTVGPIERRHHPDDSRRKYDLLSLEELKDRTQQLKAWCKEADEKRKRSSSTSSSGMNAQKSHGEPTYQRAPTEEFFTLLEAWMERSKEIGYAAAQQAADLYTVMQTTSPAKDYLSLYHLDVVLEACADCNGGERAAILAEQMFVRSFSPPSTKTYNILMKCWARSGSPHAGKKVDALLRQMFQEETCYPTNYTIASYMDAWARSGQPNAPEMASGLLRQVLLERNSNYAPPPPPAAATDGNDRPPHRWYRDVELNQPIFHGVLNAWIMSGRGRSAALEAERVLNSMHQFGVEPNVVTYALLTSAWAHAERTEGTGDAALRAETILNAMVKQQMRPNAVLFTTVMSAWSMADRNRIAPERAEALLRQLTAIYKQSGNDKAYEPSVEAENAVLSAWARSKRPDAVSRTQRYLSTMSHPDLVTYNTVLDCFANNGKSQAALELFETMKKHENKALRPDIVSYNSLLNALARAEAPIEEVEKVLHEMEDVMSPVEPDKFSYTCVLDAWAKSSHPDRLMRCRRLVDIMIFRFVKRKKERSKPDAFVFTTLIKACLNTDDPRSLKVATEALERLEIHFKPANDVAYTLYIRALIKFAGTDVQLAQTVEKCIKGGFLSSKVVGEIYKAGKIHPNPRSLIRAYEPSWSRNVRERDRPQRHMSANNN